MKAVGFTVGAKTFDVLGTDLSLCSSAVPSEADISPNSTLRAWPFL